MMSSPPSLVREAVAAADRRRRSRDASRRLWRAAPLVAAGGLVAAGVARWAGWPAAVPLGVLAAGAAALAAYLIVSRRPHPVSDAVAAAIDADAGLGGELRSANWFAARPRDAEWTDLHDLHLVRAADRVRAVDWTQLYPPVRARRERIATSLIVCATLVVAIVFPGSLRGTASGSVAESKADATAAIAKPAETPPGLLLTPELQKQLEALLAAAEAGTLAVDQNGVPSAELREFLAKLGELRDREGLKDLARAMDASGNTKERSAAEMKALAERARRAAEMAALSREFREVMEDLARRLSDAADDENVDAEKAMAASSSTDPQPGDAGKTNAATSMDEASIQAIKEAQPAGAAGVTMMSSQDAAAGDSVPGSGVGGSGGMNAAAGTAAIEAALRQETVEAAKDTAGENVITQIRRKTEEGHATAAFTRSASGPSDRNRAAAPPAVPETRRTDVQRYFIRKP